MESAPRIPVQVAAQPYTGLEHMHWLNEGLASGYQHHMSDGWPSAGAGAKARHLPSSFKILFASWLHDGANLLVEAPGVIASLDISRGSISLRVLAKNRRRAEAIVARFRKLFPKDEASPEKPRVLVNFWNMGSHGPTSSSRWIDAQPWERSAGNYPNGTRQSLNDLMATRPAEGSGKLILWNGEPGTGKTHAIRSLAWEWRDWADLQYIADPERFLGSESEYLLGMLTSAQRDQDENRWFVVVLEDSGEMLAPDARQQIGQALSRLLNIGDGMLGQGIRLLTLITTNEPLDRIHQAVGRPGRCLARVSFERFQVKEAAAWLSNQASPEATKRLVGQTASLAQLFALASNREWSEPTTGRPVGFTAVGFSAV